MDRKTRRVRRIRIRSRRTKLAAGLALAAVSIAALATTALAQSQGPSDKPTPEVDQVDLTPAPVPVGAGWEGQVGTDANLVAVQWNGDPSTNYTFEVRDQQGTWRKAADSGTFDNGPDPGTADQERHRSGLGRQGRHRRSGEAGQRVSRGRDAPCDRLDHR
jgi:hypothetical protein